MISEAIPRLDPLGAPLEGVSLIEASAGTGKTYTITGLYLRLILETDFRVDQILVVTYTIAATEELRDRTRRRLVAASDAFRRGGSDDAFLDALVKRAEDPHEAMRKIESALRGFDEAAIYTIHGFCQRVLADSAFESGMPFETDLVPDPRETLQEIVDDFWRRELYNASSAFVGYMLDKRESPDDLATNLMSYLGKPDLEVLGDEAAGEFEGVEGRFGRAYAAVREAWPLSREAVTEILVGDTALNRNKYRQGSVEEWIEKLAHVLQPNEPRVGRFEKFDKFEKFTTSCIAGAIKKGKIAPEHPFFDLCEILHQAESELQAMYRAKLVDFKKRLYEWSVVELEARNKRDRVQSFDDLVVNLLRGLRAPRGERLAEAIRSTYGAALIDEFQDTDPVQYEIFHRVYGESEGLPVVFVGDPKQAIYSFRGADIFAYLRARGDADRKFTLDVNWRSCPKLIDGVNALFERSPNPFLFDGIPYVSAEPADRSHVDLVENGVAESPMRIWRVPPDEDGRKLDVGAAEEICATATAAEIVRLLNLAAKGKATLDGRRLAGGDIAVLVRTHYQGRSVRDALIQLGVPSVQHSQDDVFMTQEAEELERVLMAVVEPGREILVRAALATDLIGLTGEALHALVEDERAWVEWIERFHELSATWRDHGFIRMFRGLMAELGVAGRLLEFRDGERRLTNLLHLSELLQTNAKQSAGGMEGLVQWLADRRDINRLLAEDDQRLLRLESDENLVKIVTMHRSKGLEYPVVFCPFLWHGAIRAKWKKDFLFHRDGRTVADFGSPEQDEHRERAVFEERAENLRLMYVALTRAKARCYLVWGAIKESMRSAPAELIHAHRGGSEAKKVTEAETIADLTAIEESAGGAIRVETIQAERGKRYEPRGEREPKYAAREFDGRIATGWRMSSFSSLVTGHGAEIPDHDTTAAEEAATEEAATEAVAAAEIDAPSPTAVAPEARDSLPATVEGDERAPTSAASEAAPSSGEVPAGAAAGESSRSRQSTDHDSPASERSVFTFPRGTRAGTCWHALFERIDFTRADQGDLDAHVERVLGEHGFSPEWTGVVREMVDRVLDARLDGDDGDPLRLRDASIDRRVCELEFHYPLRRMESPGLAALLRDHGLGDEAAWAKSIGRLAFSPTRGTMKGFIDLVFEAGGRYYIVDYKSNWLGGDVTAYDAASVRDAMGRSSYFVQYLVYTVALHRYLALRVPDYDYDTHFGGVFYLFLRGMGQGVDGDAVFRDRPARDLVAAFDAYVASDAPPKRRKAKTKKKRAEARASSAEGSEPAKKPTVNASKKKARRSTEGKDADR